METKGFNPTPQNQVDLECAIIELKATKAKHVVVKIKKQSEVAAQKDILNDPRLERKDYEYAKAKRVKLRQELDEIEANIKKVNVQMMAKKKLLISVNNHLKCNKSKLDSENDLLKQITILKDHYSRFSVDSTRVPSMRTMAAEISRELEHIINSNL